MAHLTCTKDSTYLQWQHRRRVSTSCISYLQSCSSYCMLQFQLSTCYPLLCLVDICSYYIRTFCMVSFIQVSSTLNNQWYNHQLYFLLKQSFGIIHCYCFWVSIWWYSASIAPFLAVQNAFDYDIDNHDQDLLANLFCYWKSSTHRRIYLNSKCYPTCLVLLLTFIALIIFILNVFLWFSSIKFDRYSRCWGSFAACISKAAIEPQFW